MLQSLEGMHVTVMGLGHFGGGVGVSRWLVGQGASVLVTDQADEARLADSRAKLADLLDRGLLSMRLGGHNVADFTTCDLVVANPAVPTPWNDRYLRSARAADVPITTEIRLLVERLPDRGRGNVIGVTGSAGKSTTSAMIHHLLQAVGRTSHLGGNFGGSLLTSLKAISKDDWVVLELSSAMLYWLGEHAGSPDDRGWSPRYAVLTNISPNHLDWHGSFEHYRESKLNIFRWQDASGRQFRGDAAQQTDRRIDLSVPGAHNQRNARLAVHVVEAATGIAADDLERHLRGFRGLPHRLQLVCERDGLRFYNDSKSTTPEATVLAVNSFEEPARVHLIAGGYDKKIDLSAIAALAGCIGGLYTIGATGKALAESSVSNSKYCETLDEAVRCALNSMQSGDVLLLSPGCASWDQFLNFESRGDEFVRLVSHEPIAAV